MVKRMATPDSDLLLLDLAERQAARIRELEDTLRRVESQLVTAQPHLAEAVKNSSMMAACQCVDTHVGLALELLRAGLQGKRDGLMA